MKINKKLDNLLRKQGYIKLPFVMYVSGHIVFEIVLNNLPAKFLIDTGASGTILTKECIGKFSLQVEETEESGTGAGSTNLEMQNSINNSLVFKDYKIENLNLFIMDLAHVNNSFIEIEEDIIDGVIGADILSKYNCILDYKGNVFYILPFL
jgi:hypothetical protein